MIIFLSLICILFLTTSIFLVWYSIKSIQKISFITESVEDVLLEIEIFRKHIKQIYELDMFYGDETLKDLIIHSKDLIKEFEQFQKDFETYNGVIDEKEILKLEEENNRNDRNDDIRGTRTIVRNEFDERKETEETEDHT